MSLCACNSGGGNTGRPSCYEVFGTAKKLIFVEYLKPDGTVNGIEVATLTGGKLDPTYLDARIKDANPRTRWYPTPNLVTVTDERADDITEEIDNTQTVFIEDGVRAFEGFTLKGDPVFVGNMNSWKCLTAGVFAVDKDGNLQGAEIVDGFLYPVKLQDESLSAQLIKASVTNSTSSKTRIKFAIDELEDDANLRMLEAVDITADLKGATGLVDVIAGTPTGISTTGFTVQLNTTYGGITNPIPAEGLDGSDFSGVELSPTPGAITITSAIESTITPGLYTFLIVAETSGDLLEIRNQTPGPLAKNFDLTPFQVTIP
jgi:hypothetical protein